MAKNVKNRKFKYILSSGAPLFVKDCEFIRNNLLSKYGVMYGSYGASEVGSICLGTWQEIESENGCVGRVLDDVDLEIEDEQVKVKTPTMIKSQVKENGWFYPGDKGEIKDGLLILKGRI